jgi:hypothetical protein
MATRRRIKLPFPAWSTALPLCVAAAACTGVIGDGDDVGEGVEPPGSTPTNFVCDENAVPEALPLRRLSQLQYNNTVRDLVSFLAPSDDAAIHGEIAIQFEALPDDQRIGTDKTYAGFKRLDQAVQQDHIDTVYRVAAAAAASLTANTARLSETAGACATDGDSSNDDDCLDELIRRFGERAMRKAISDEDIAFYRGPAGSAPFDAADYADVIALILNAPHTLYFVEHGRAGADGATAPLAGYELAARVSYHFWQTLPDDALFEAARSGELETEAGFQAQVERVFNDAKTKAALATFFGQWLENSSLQELDSRVGTPIFDSFVGNFVPGPDLRENMFQEVVDSALYYSVDAPGTFADLLTSDKSFAKTDDLASIYGVPVWSSGEPPTLDDPARVGLLTRAAYLSTGSANTRPIMKGVFIRKALLCDDIPPPPPNVGDDPPEATEDASTREAVDALTGTGSCAGCHTVLINPLGYATENFDALGRVRATQLLYDDQGNEVGSAPIRTDSVPLVEGDDDTPTSGAGELTDLILESPKPYACFARQYFRFTFGRLEDLDRDACALKDVKDALDDDLPLPQVLRAIALSKSFQERSFDE